MLGRVDHAVNSHGFANDGDHFYSAPSYQRRRLVTCASFVVNGSDRMLSGGLALSVRLSVLRVALEESGLTN